ncbi:MAG TPA: STAS-like domain-containing protein [Flavipsychrobacter sp.]|nr:STAS-like domain-containing protein [Flavipsychrobacter sp.]
MKPIIHLKNYGIILSDKNVGDTILAKIHELLKAHDIIELDFDAVTSMATFCSKQIFGSLYLTLGSDEFFRKLLFRNVNEDMQLLIKIGIQSAVEES